MSNEIIVRDYLKGEVSIGQDLIGRICSALNKAETVIIVNNVQTQAQAVDAQRDIKEIIYGVNKAREKAKAPVLELGRRIDALAKDTVAELEKEHARVTECIVDYQREQQRLADEAEAKRQAELRRIEAENRRIEQEAMEAQRKIEADRRAEAERIAAAARKAEQDAANARNAIARAKADAERAELMRKQAEHDARVKAEREAANREMQARSDAAVKAMAQVGPVIEAPQAKGQIIRREIEVIVMDVHALYRDKPNAVTMEPRIAYLKELYHEGQTKIKGVEFREKIISTTRSNGQKVLDV